MVVTQSVNNNVTQVIMIILFVVLATSSCSYFYNKLTDRVEPITSDIDGKHYSVRSDVTDKQETADYLATISEKVDNLVKYMVANDLPDKDISDRLESRWGGCKFRETASHEVVAAYTINKGDEMRLCVRDSNNGLENINTSMFVVLHELAHIMSVTYGHNEEFRNNFSYIVHLASSLGYYKPEDFENKPVSYCGTEINTTPCMSGTCEYTPSQAPDISSIRNTRGLYKY
jgi:hypothetical protein